MYSRKAGGGPATTAWSSNKPKQRGGSPSQGPNRSQSTVKSTHSRSKAAKSAEVLRLEKLIDAIEKGVDSKAGQAGCFCMGEKHPSCPQSCTNLSLHNELKPESTRSPSTPPSVPSAVSSYVNFNLPHRHVLPASPRSCRITIVLHSWRGWRTRRRSNSHWKRKSARGNAKSNSFEERSKLVVEHSPH